MESEELVETRRGDLAVGEGAIALIQHMQRQDFPAMDGVILALRDNEESRWTCALCLAEITLERVEHTECGVTEFLRTLHSTTFAAIQEPSTTSA